jgi:hypothetical protein
MRLFRYESRRLSDNSDKAVVSKYQHDILHKYAEKSLPGIGTNSLHMSAPRVECMLYPSRYNVLDVLPMDSEDAIHYGLELELNLTSDDSRFQFINAFYPLFGHVGILKRELSVKMGLEIVTRPLTMPRLISVIPALVDFCKTHGAFMDEQTGIHIHASKAWGCDAGAIFRVVNAPRHREEMISIAGRITDFARFTTRDVPRNPTRGYSVNIRPSTTVEFRMFAGNLDTEWIQGCIYFCHLVRAHTARVRSFTDLVTIAQEEGLPAFFLERLRAVRVTPPGARYPLVQPEPCSEALRYW